MNDDQAEIRALLTGHAEAIGRKDARAALAPFAPDAVVFDLAPPLQVTATPTEAKAELEEWFATWDGPIGIEATGMKIVVDGDLAYCHGFTRISGTKTGGQETGVWARTTNCLRRTDGQWKIVHHHISVPFYMDGSLRAAVDLEP